MIVSEGVREMRADHPPEYRRRALELVAQGDPANLKAHHLETESCLQKRASRHAIDALRKLGCLEPSGLCGSISSELLRSP